MSAVTVDVSVQGMERADAVLRGIIGGLESRVDLHMRIARAATLRTQRHLESDAGHKTANSLGATPTGHRRKSAARIQPEWDDEAAIVSIPRNTGLGRAFHDVDIVPKKNPDGFLPIAADARSYGKSPRDFPEGVLEFGIDMSTARPRRALLFVADGKPAYWLIRKAHQKQDRDLLPSDDSFRALAREESRLYIQELIAAERGSAGPYGGTSTGMPSA